MISMMLGGHASNKLIEKDIYTGAQSDLKRATDIVRHMITKLGMSEEIGTIYLGSDQEVFVGMEFGQSREFSEEVAAKIDNEISKTLDECYKVAMDTLKEHIDELHGLANLLIEKETINREEFVAFIDTYKEPEPEPVTDAE
jgi:cell division protease FtsH